MLCGGSVPQRAKNGPSEAAAVVAAATFYGNLFEQRTLLRHAGSEPMPAHRIVFTTIALLGAMILGAIQPSTSASATRILVQENSKKLVALSPSRGQPHLLFRLRQGALLSIGASSNGKVIAFVTRSWDKSSVVPVWTDRIWIIRRGHPARVVRAFVSPRTHAKNQIDSIAVSPGGRRILINSRGGAAFMLHSDGAHFHRLTVPGYSFGVGGGGNSSGPEFTPDGRRIVGVFYPVGAEEEDLGGIGTTSVDGGRIHFLRRGPFRNGVGIAFAPTISRDGRLIAFATADKSGHRIVVMRRDGTKAHRLSWFPNAELGNCESVLFAIRDQVFGGFRVLVSRNRRVFLGYLTL